MKELGSMKGVVEKEPRGVRFRGGGCFNRHPPHSWGVREMRESEDIGSDVGVALVPKINLKALALHS